MTVSVKIKAEATIGDYFKLFKPEVTTLVVFTAIIESLLCIKAGAQTNWFVVVMVILCIAIASGASGAINMWYDADIDSIMQRTKKRPIPSGKIDAQTALEFGSVLAFLSVFVCQIVAGTLAALCLLFSILFYVFVYTIWLKRTSVQNIVIGGAAGAFPPIIAQSAIEGTITLQSILLFLIIFMWTPPHFWSLCIKNSDEYKKVNVPMLTVVKGDKVTKAYILFYTILLFICCLLPYIYGHCGKVYLIVCVILNVRFLWYAISLIQIKDPQHYKPYALRMFKFSITYLFALFGSILVDAYFKV